MKNTVAIVTLAGLLSACAVAPQPQLAAPVPAPAPAAPVVAEAAAPVAEAALPNVQLTSDLLYRLLKAEFDFKNGNWQGPYMTLMGSAQQTRDPRLARRAAEMAIGAKQASESMAAIRLWRELAPTSEEATQYYLGLAVMSDQLGEAEALFRQRLQEATPEARGMAIFQIQQYLVRARDKAAAGAMLERLLAPFTELFEAHVVLAQLAYTRNDMALAHEHAMASLKQKPSSELAILTVAQVTPDADAVAALLAKFVAANPAALEVRMALARVLVTQKQYDKARVEFLALLKVQPDNLATLYALGIMSMQLSDNAGAEKYLSHFVDVLAERPNDERDPSKVLMMLSNLAEERGDIKAALSWLDKVDGADVHASLQAQLKRAQLVARQGDLDAARKALDALKTEDAGEQAQVLLTHGQILRDASQNETAYTLLEGAAKRFPGNADVLYDYALAAEKTGRVDVMETTLRAVIAQAPDNHHAYNALGYSLAERNVRLPEALELIDKAMKMAPDDPFIMDSLGWVQYRLGKLDEAEATLRRAYALRRDAEIAVHLGEVLWQRGKKADAQKILREARAKDPQNDTLKSTLARLNVKL
ncbi:MAG: tetratricopeptide repeat protein [Pseudomonadota bacterium]